MFLVTKKTYQRDLAKKDRVIEKLKKNHKEEIEIKDIELNNVKFENLDYKDQIDRLDSEKRDLKNTCKVLKVEKDNLTELIEKMTDAARISKGQITRLKNQKTKLETNLLKSREIIFELEKDIKRIKNKPTIEELKTEKMLKIDKNKLVGCKKR